MPENLRSLIVILILATIFFAFTSRSIAKFTNLDSFTRRRNLWLALTLVAFLAYNFWLYSVIAILLVFHAKKHEPNTPALFFSILFVLPVAYIQIPGMGLINYFFDLSHARLLALIILLPAFFALRRQVNYFPFGHTRCDKALAAYILLGTMLYLRQTSVTDTLRQFFYMFVDIFLPYIVISRSLKNLQSFRDALFGLVLAIMVLAPLAVFESLKHWLLYAYLTTVLDLKQGMTGYLGRSGILRAIVTAGQPIVLGYLMVIGIGLYLFLQRSIKHKLARRLGMLLLVTGLITPLSRGPWMGAAVMLIVFFATGRHAARNLMILIIASIFILPFVSMLPGGETVINMLPFIGSTEKENIDYREQLITNSMIVIYRNPWFGSIDFLKTPEMEAMRQGEGIIDIVNTYIEVALPTGLVGLGLFVTFFALTLWSIYRSMRSIPDRDSEEYLLGRVLLATLLAIMTIIFTVSSISFIPILYWSVAALGVAYAHMVRNRID